jgi:hypothetical protein
MLLVQKFLETKTFGDLAREHGVYASFSKSGHKFSLNYDQIEAKESDPLAQECRGLVLAAEDGKSFTSMAQQVNGRNNYDHVSPGKTTVLAYPMKRFFNHGQGSAAEINWHDPKLAVLEKLDGTLCIVYWDSFTNQWCVATRSVPEADLIMDNGLYTFRTLFEKAFLETVGVPFEDFNKSLNKNFTYCFELTTPYNRIVVEYKNCGVTLLAVRSMLTHLEMNPHTTLLADCLKNVPVVQAHTYSSVQELVDWVSTLNPMEHEGVVVRDGEFNRIKVKNAAYVAYNKVRDALATSPRNMVELILAEKDDDVIPMLPEEIVKNLQVIKAGIQKVIMKYDSVYYLIMLNLKALGEKGNKKEFALLVQNHKDMWSAPFFQMFDGKASNMKEFIMNSRKDGTWGNGFLDKMLELSKKS